MEKRSYAENRVTEAENSKNGLPLPSSQGRTSQPPKGEEADALEGGTVAPQGEVGASPLLVPPFHFPLPCITDTVIFFWFSQFEVFLFFFILATHSC